MFVSDQDRGNFARIAAHRFQSLKSLAAGNSRVDQNPGARAFNQRAISSAPAGQHRNRNTHARSIHSSTVETGVTSWLSRYLRVKISKVGHGFLQINTDK